MVSKFKIRILVYICHKLWMWTIQGLLAQSVDRAKQKAQHGFGQSCDTDLLHAAGCLSEQQWRSQSWTVARVPEA